MAKKAIKASDKKSSSKTADKVANKPAAVPQKAGRNKANKVRSTKQSGKQSAKKQQNAAQSMAKTTAKNHAAQIRRAKLAARQFAEWKKLYAKLNNDDLARFIALNQQLTQFYDRDWMALYDDWDGITQVLSPKAKQKLTQKLGGLLGQDDLWNAFYDAQMLYWRALEQLVAVLARQYGTQ